jgi:hypothetical protein
MPGHLQKGSAAVMAVTLILVPFISSAFAVRGEAQTLPLPDGGTNSSSSDCQLNSARGEIQHVIFVQFDNVHFTRDKPNVPADLEQMPHLLDFIEGNGVLSTNHHTPLISHTADDIITALTGVYGDLR